MNANGIARGHCRGIEYDPPVRRRQDFLKRIKNEIPHFPERGKGCDEEWREVIFFGTFNIS